MVQVDEVFIQIRVGWNMAIVDPVSIRFRAFCESGVASNDQYDGPRENGYVALLRTFDTVIKTGDRPSLALLDDTMHLLEALREARLSQTLVEGRIRRR